LTVTFHNPKFKATGITTASLAVGMKGREKLGVPYIAVDGVEHEGDWVPRLASTSRPAATRSRCISSSRDYP
jgi:hypothetical protein